VIFDLALIGVLITMALALARAVAGPTAFDRLLAANMFGTKTMLLIAVAGFWSGRPEWLDLALLYAILGFIGAIAVAKFSRYGNLGNDDERVDP